MVGLHSCRLIVVDVLVIKLNVPDQALQHGGNLNDAAKMYGIELDQWLDLSTGISPWAWPIPTLSESVWQTLPPTDLSELLRAAADFYQCPAKPLTTDQLTVAPGSQLLIRLLPHISCIDSANKTEPRRVALPLLGYQEHALSWHMAGFELVFYQDTSQLNALIQQKTVEHAVIINPNNPSTELIEPAKINHWAEQLPGLIIVDEAFIDLQPRLSANQYLNNKNSNLVVLRSLGKFFGLAGLRIGFIFSNNKQLIKQFNALLHPWSINHAALIIAKDALNDLHWHELQRQRITQQSVIHYHYR